VSKAIACPDNCKMETCPHDGNECPIREVLEEEARILEEEKYRDWQRSQ
jgi:hypothetical protein